MWESTDGLEWSPMLVDQVSNAAMTVLGSPTVAIGRSGAPGCPDNGVAVWAPTDKSDWYRDSALGFRPGDVVVGGVEVGADQRVVATGWAAEGGPEIWITALRFFLHGRWDAAEVPPRGVASPLVALAAFNQTIVGWDSTSNSPAWYSADEGNSWSSAEFRAPYWFQATDAVTAFGQFFAAGSACCTDPGVRSGAVLNSLDGLSWSASTATVLGSVPKAIVASSFGLIAFGNETYLSSDGTSWTVGPPLPEYDGERLFAAALGGTVLVASPTRVWVASALDLRPEHWPNLAPSPEPSEVGVSHSYHLVTACGPHSPIHFDLRTWLPDEASLPNGDWPRSFDRSEEWGHLTLADGDLLEFTGTRAAPDPGAVVRYLPVENPPATRPCA